MTYDTIQTDNIFYKSEDITITKDELDISYRHCALQSIRQVSLTSKASGKAKLLYIMVVVFVVAYEIVFMQLLLSYPPLLPHRQDNPFIGLFKNLFWFATYVLPIFSLFAITTAGIRKNYHFNRLVIDYATDSEHERMEIENPTPELIRCLDCLAPIRLPEMPNSNITVWHLVVFVISTIAVSLGLQYLRFCNYWS